MEISFGFLKWSVLMWCSAFFTFEQVLGSPLFLSLTSTTAETESPISDYRRTGKMQSPEMQSFGGLRILFGSLTQSVANGIERANLIGLPAMPAKQYEQQRTGEEDVRMDDGIDAVTDRTEFAGLRLKEDKPPSVFDRFAFVNPFRNRSDLLLPIADLWSEAAVRIDNLKRRTPIWKDNGNHGAGVGVSGGGGGGVSGGGGGVSGGGVGNNDDDNIDDVDDANSDRRITAVNNNMLAKLIFRNVFAKNSVDRPVESAAEESGDRDSGDDELDNDEAEAMTIEPPTKITVNTKLNARLLEPAAVYVLELFGTIAGLAWGIFTQIQSAISPGSPEPINK